MPNNTTATEPTFDDCYLSKLTMDEVGADIEEHGHVPVTPENATQNPFTAKGSLANALDDAMGLPDEVIPSGETPSPSAEAGIPPDNTTVDSPTAEDVVKKGLVEALDAFAFDAHDVPETNEEDTVKVEEEVSVSEEDEDEKPDKDGLVYLQYVFTIDPKTYVSNNYQPIKDAASMANQKPAKAVLGKPEEVAKENATIEESSRIEVLETPKGEEPTAAEEKAAAAEANAEEKDAEDEAIDKEVLDYATFIDGSSFLCFDEISGVDYSSIVMDAAPKKAVTKPNCKTTFAQCRAKNPLYCRFHGPKLLEKDIKQAITALVGKNNCVISVTKDKSAKNPMTFRLTVGCIPSMKKKVDDMVHKFLTQNPGITSEEKWTDVGSKGGKEMKTAEFEMDILQADKPPKKSDWALQAQYDTEMATAKGIKQAVVGETPSKIEKIAKGELPPMVDKKKPVEENPIEEKPEEEVKEDTSSEAEQPKEQPGITDEMISEIGEKMRKAYHWVNGRKFINDALSGAIIMIDEAYNAIKKTVGADHPILPAIKQAAIDKLKKDPYFFTKAHGFIDNDPHAPDYAKEALATEAEQPKNKPEITDEAIEEAADKLVEEKHWPTETAKQLAEALAGDRVYSDSAFKEMKDTLGEDHPIVQAIKKAAAHPNFPTDIPEYAQEGGDKDKGDSNPTAQASPYSAHKENSGEGTIEDLAHSPELANFMHNALDMQDNEKIKKLTGETIDFDSMPASKLAQLIDAAEKMWASNWGGKSGFSHNTDTEEYKAAYKKFADLFSKYAQGGETKSPKGNAKSESTPDYDKEFDSANESMQSFADKWAEKIWDDDVDDAFQNVKTSFNTLMNTKGNIEALESSLKGDLGAEEKAKKTEALEKYKSQWADAVKNFNKDKAKMAKAFEKGADTAEGSAEEPSQEPKDDAEALSEYEYEIDKMTAQVANNYEGDEGCTLAIKAAKKNLAGAKASAKGLAAIIAAQKSLNDGSAASRFAMHTLDATVKEYQKAHTDNMKKLAESKKMFEEALDEAKSKKLDQKKAEASEKVQGIVNSVINTIFPSGKPAGVGDYDDMVDAKSAVLYSYAGGHGFDEESTKAIDNEFGVQKKKKTAKEAHKPFKDALQKCYESIDESTDPNDTSDITSNTELLEEAAIALQDAYDEYSKAIDDAKAKMKSVEAMNKMMGVGKGDAKSKEDAGEENAPTLTREDVNEAYKALAKEALFQYFDWDDFEHLIEKAEWPIGDSSESLLNDYNQELFKAGIDKLAKAKGIDHPVVKSMVAAYKSHPEYDMSGLDKYDSVAVQEELTSNSGQKDSAEPTEADWKEAENIVQNTKEVGDFYGLGEDDLLPVLKTAKWYDGDELVSPNQSMYVKAINAIADKKGVDSPVVKAMVAAYKSIPDYNQSLLSQIPGLEDTPQDSSKPKSYSKAELSSMSLKDKLTAAIEKAKAMLETDPSNGTLKGKLAQWEKMLEKMK